MSNHTTPGSSDARSLGVLDDFVSWFSDTLFGGFGELLDRLGLGRAEMFAIGAILSVVLLLAL